jgi:hypothetical protein
MQQIENKKNHNVIYIFILAFIVRCGAYVTLGRLTDPRFWEYHDIAENFLQGKGLAYSFLGITSYTYAEPFYPLLSAFTYYITNHNYLIFGIINMLASSAIAIVIYYLGKELFDKRVGLVAAIFTAIHPGLIYFSTQFHPLTFNTLFTVLVLLAVTKLSKTLRTKDAVFSGLTIALAFLDRFSCLIFIPLTLGFIIFFNCSLRQKIKLCAIITLIALIPVAGWTVRNYAIFHKPVITRSSAGYLLWIGNNPKTTNSACYNQKTAMIDTLDKDSIEKLKNMDELGINKYLMNEAVSFIKSHPREFLSRWAKRFCYFWWFSPLEGMRYPQAWLMLYKTFYALIFFTVAYALASIVFNHKKYVKAYLPGICFTAIVILALAVSQTLFYVEGRHRWVVEPVLMIFSSWAILRIADFLRKRRRLLC